MNVEDRECYVNKNESFKYIKYVYILLYQNLDIF
jgi:hypothetical protein